MYFHLEFLAVMFLQEKIPFIISLEPDNNKLGKMVTWDVTTNSKSSTMMIECWHKMKLKKNKFFREIGESVRLCITVLWHF